MNSPRRLWLIALLAFVTAIAYAAFAGHAWEDYFITLRSSRNLVEGHGLVFNPGERVQTYTSPLGVLVPAFCTWIVGVGHEALALWLYRLVSAAALAGAAALLWHRSKDASIGPFGRFVLFGLLLLDPKLAEFATDGMETGLLVFFEILLWTELEAASGPRTGILAIAFAGLMWTRPDGCVLAAALVLPHLWLPSPAGVSRRRGWRPLLRGAGWGALLYAPWFLWAWSYYGTVVPHTVVAKAAVAPPVDWLGLVLLPLKLVGFASPLDDLFLPAYWHAGGWPLSAFNWGHALAGLAALAWLIPGLPAAGRRASLAVLLGAFYLGAIYVYPWYVPAWTVVGVISLAGLADWAARRAAALGRWRLRGAIIAAAAVTVALQAGLFCCVAWQMRVQQRVIENQGRRVIGEWLHAHAAPGDRVFLETLGYIGYYSNLKMLDLPGLSAPEVTQAIRSGVTAYTDLIARFKPEWLVLRPLEIQRQGITKDWLLSRYRLAKVIDNEPLLDATGFLPGRAGMEVDARFLILERLDHGRQQR